MQTEIFSVKKIIIVIVALIVTGTAFAQKYPGVKCQILQMESFCDLPSIANDVDLNTVYNPQHITCEQLDLLENKVAIRITFIPQTRLKLKLITGFKNIGLVRQNGTVVHPFAMINIHDYNRDKPVFLSSKSKISLYDITFKAGKQCDIVLVFDQAKVGEKIRIDDFLEAEIQE